MAWNPSGGPWLPLLLHFNLFRRPAASSRVFVAPRMTCSSSLPCSLSFRDSSSKVRGFEELSARDFEEPSARDLLALSAFEDLEWPTSGPLISS
eukprot:Skav209517  [mRNA]  locus=scaffold2767:287396:289362:+ [translate_table: standard]